MPGDVGPLAYGNNTVPSDKGSSEGSDAIDAKFKNTQTNAGPKCGTCLLAASVVT